MSDFETNFIFNPKSNDWGAEDYIKYPNRAMNFGDGVFESMVFSDGKIRFLEKHDARLRAGLKVLGLLEDRINIQKLEAFLLEKNGSKKCRVRWNVFRAKSGTYTPQTQETLQTLHIKEYATPVAVKEQAYISTRIKLFPNAWSHAKTLNALPYVLANQERLEKEMDEVILLDHRGFIAEAGSSNIFWKIGADIFTPSLKCSCIAGVGRAVILESLNSMGIEIQQGSYLPEHLAKASTVWVSNAMGISYLKKIGQVEYAIEPLPFLEKLFK